MKILDIELWVIADGVDMARKMTYKTENTTIIIISNLQKVFIKI